MIFFIPFYTFKCLISSQWNPWWKRKTVLVRRQCGPDIFLGLNHTDGVLEPCLDHLAHRENGVLLRVILLRWEMVITLLSICYLAWVSGSITGNNGHTPGPGPHWWRASTWSWSCGPQEAWSPPPGHTLKEVIKNSQHRWSCSDLW